jgi:hypothetical protein
MDIAAGFWWINQERDDWREKKNYRGWVPDGRGWVEIAVGNR